MPKPVCVKCGLFFKPHITGTAFEEGKPYRSTVKEKVRHVEPDGTEWTGYKLWMGDTYKCRGCKAEIIVGVVAGNFSEHYKDNYKAMQEKYGGDKMVFVHDC
jgi:hypothetical protein